MITNNVHAKPTQPNKKEVRSAVIDNWKFNHLDRINLTHYVVSGGKLVIPTSSKERMLIITDGLGNVTDTKQVVREGTVIEVAPSQRIELHGQLKFYLIEA